MGYTTLFFGNFSLNKKLDKDLHDYLVKFNETRRMKRDTALIKIKLSKGEAEWYADTFGSVGLEGGFFVGGVGYMGQDNDESVFNHNEPPTGQPSLWCQWRPSNNGKHIEWDEGEKFYYYTEWLRYICDNFLGPKGYILNGEVRFQGEDSSDTGWIICENNRVRLSDYGGLLPAEHIQEVEIEVLPPPEETKRTRPERKINWKTSTKEK